MLELHSLADENADLHAELAQLQQRLETLTAQRDFAFQLMNTMGQGLAVLDKDSQIEYVNPAFARMVGLDEAELIGRSTLSLTDPREHPTLLQARLDRQRGLTTSYETYIRKSDGSELCVLVTGAPRLNESNEQIGTISVLTDMSEYKRLEATIARKTQLIELVRYVASAANAAGTLKDAIDTSMDFILASGSWELGHVYLPDADDSQYVVASGWWYGPRRANVQLFQSMTESGPVLRGQGLPGQVYETGRPVWFTDLGASGIVRRAYAARELGIKTACAFPIVLHDHVVAILEMFAWESLPIETELMEVMANIGVQLGCVIERHQSHLALHRQQYFLQVILDNIADGIIACNMEGTITHVNRALMEFHGISDLLLPMGLQQLGPDVFDADGIGPIEGHEMPLNRALNGAVFNNLELTIAPPQRPRRTVLAQGQPLKTAKGEQLGAVVVVHDITRQKLLECQREALIQQLQTNSMTDLLTNVYNRRGWFTFAQPHWDEAESNNPLGIMLLDVDFFKKVNDTYGHAVGDTVLQNVASRCCRAIRATDILGRYGGEEFVIMLPRSDVSTVGAVAERIRASFETEPISATVGPLPITVSIGIAMRDATIPDLDQLICRADTALYNAKHHGRNQVQMWHAPA